MRIPTRRQIAIRKRHWTTKLNHVIHGVKSFHHKHPTAWKIEAVVGVVFATVLVVFLHALWNPFEQADIFPLNNPQLTAGTITAPSQTNTLEFTLVTGNGNSTQTISEKVPGTQYTVGNTRITLAVTDQAGNPSEDFNVSLAKGEGGPTVALTSKYENQFTPGTYQLVATLSRFGKKKTVKQNFALGILTMNTLKSAYVVGEDAVVHFGVVNERGTNLCDIPLELEITSPLGDTSTLKSGSGIINQPTCNGTSDKALPLYSASFPVGQPGTYSLVLTADTPNGRFFIEDTLAVEANNASFIVERVQYPTHIMPLLPHQVVLSVTAQDKFTGEISEQVPPSFTIHQIGQSTTIPPDTSSTIISPPPIENGQKSGQPPQVITWPVSLTKGGTIYLHYTFQSPKAMTGFYLLGPLQLKTGGSTVVFEEPRKWGMHL